MGRPPEHAHSDQGAQVKRLLITWFYLGHLRPAPGTWGSLGALIPYAAVWWLCCAITGDAPAAPWQTTALIVASLAAFLLGGLLGPWAVEFFRTHRPPTSFGKSDEQAVHDPSAFVLDEVAGQWMALAFIPATHLGLWPLALNCFIAFFWFRLFDVLKPPPCRKLETLPHGWGIGADDVVAGIYAGVMSWLTLWSLGALLP